MILVRLSPSTAGVMALLFIARMREDSKDGKVWAIMEGSVEELKARDIHPLYLSKREHHMDTSLMVSTPSPERLLDALLDLLSDVPGADGLWLFPVMRPKFFEVPANIGRGAGRYLVTISVRPSDAMRVYDTISTFRSSSDLGMIYLAFTCQRFCDMLTLSVFARSDEHAERFVTQELKNIQGILRVRTDLTRGKRLLPYAEILRILHQEVGDIDVARPMMDQTDLQ